MKQYTTTSRLRLRSTPVILDNNIITVLPQNTLVNNNDTVAEAQFLKVSVPYLSNIDGYVSTQFLAEYIPSVTVAVEEPVNPILDIPEVHLPIAPGTIVTRINNANRWLPLNEAGMPRRIIDSETTKKDSIASIIEWLNVEANARYLRTEQSTYCNIYAYDFCRCAGVFLPHVFWTSGAVLQIKNGVTVKPQLGSTIFELNANALYNWFKEFGEGYKWRREYNLSKFQEAVNKGSIGIAVGQRIDLNRSGHVTVVVPETNSFKALRQGEAVFAPLQSQAGAVNHKYYASQWWNDASKFRAFGFWIHE